jgi:hypothetical protein
MTLEHQAMQPFPESDDPLVQALQRLLAREGGHVAVGDAAEINDQSLYQIAYMKPDSKTGRLKGVGPSIRSRLTKRYPDWLSAMSATHSTPDEGEAQPMTLVEFTVPPKIDWEGLMKLDELPPLFTLAVPDAALAPKVSKGERFIFATGATPRPGVPVLVQDGDGRRYVREYAQGRGDEWEARAENGAYVSLLSGRDGLTLLAVAKWRALDDDAS